MSSHAMGLVVGGLIPIFLLGLAAILAKASTRAGIGVGPFIAIEGVCMVGVGCVASWILPTGIFSVPGGLAASGGGLFLGLGAGLSVLALGHYQVPVSQIAPLDNMHPLVTVIVALWLFAEWQQADAGRILLGAVLIVTGGIVISRA